MADFECWTSVEKINIVPSLALFEQKIVLKGVVHLASTACKESGVR